jgi:FecR protein
MEDDYLWDPSAAPDPEVERLERMLGRLRTTHAAPPSLQAVRNGETVRLKADPACDTNDTDDEPASSAWSASLSPSAPVRWRTLRFLAPALAAAAAIVVMVGLAWRTVGPAASWEVISLSGQPRIGSSTLVGEGRLAVGQTLVTDGSSRARVDVATIGQVTIDPQTRVRLVSTRDGHHQLSLERGTLHAVISAPPGQFVVDMPSATATDLGCAYTLRVDEVGAGLLNVTAGWVALDLAGRESFVPVGASCRTHPTLGPGTPWYDDAGEGFRQALDELDFGRDPARRADALKVVLAGADTGQAVTLWHLIARVDAADRAAVVDALIDQLPMPPGVTRDAVLRLDHTALDRWWNALGLGDAGWWRTWTRNIPAGGR